MFFKKLIGIRKFTTVIKNTQYGQVKENKIYTEGYEHGKSDGIWQTIFFITVGGGLFISGRVFQGGL